MDLVDFPQLGGEALLQAFNFLLDRLGHVLDRRVDQGDEAEGAVDPDVLQGSWRPVEPREDIVEAELAHLHELAGAMRVHQRRLDRLDAADEDLRADLAALRSVLERVYGQRITFQGEDRESTGVTVDQEASTVSGELIGADGERVQGTGVRQRVRDVPQGGAVIGVRGKIIGR